MRQNVITFTGHIGWYTRVTVPSTSCKISFNVLWAHNVRTPDFLCYLHVLSTFCCGWGFSLRYIQFYQPGTETGFSWPQPSHHKLGTELQTEVPRWGAPEVAGAGWLLGPHLMAGGWHRFEDLCSLDAIPSFSSCSNPITIQSCKREVLSLNFWSINSLKSFLPL